MFSQLFFVLLALTLINFTPSEGLTFWVQNPDQAFLWGLAGYAALLVLIVCQTNVLAKSSYQRFWWPLLNAELLLFFCLYHFGLGAQRFFQQGAFSSAQTPYALASLCLYFFAYGWAHVWTAYFQLKRSFKKSLKSAGHQLLFLAPFCIPFAVISVLLDSLEYLPGWSALGDDHPFLFTTFGISLLLLLIIFLPVCMRICWRCRPLEKEDLARRLESLCKSLQFRHAGLKIWSALPHDFTAGIIGVAASFRYILFTRPLLNRFQPEEIEAILVHEIGHHHYRHLLIYPFIMLGMILTAGLILAGLENWLPYGTDPTVDQPGYFTLLILLFSGYALAAALYFRIVFGFFSRLFERQADLHIFDSPLSPVCMIEALDRLGTVTGKSHDIPSWHHFSLRERMQFLSEAMENPALVRQHHRKVKKWLFLYFFGLVLSSIAYYYLVSSLNS